MLLVCKKICLLTREEDKENSEEKTGLDISRPNNSRVCCYCGAVDYRV